MSKTNSTVLCETNQIQGQPQENVFFHSLYRTQADFPNEFLRSAKSTSPIQIMAIFSTIGPDNLGAFLNIALNEELMKVVDSYTKQPVLDYESFSNQVVNVLNVAVCNFIVKKGGVPLKASMTMLIIEGDTLRVIQIGNTKAVLIRDNKIMALTEEQTVAHRYVQMGAITADQERTHPENMNLTQYLGKMPQDGQVVADKKVHIKLKDGDELCIMGLGISRMMPSQMRNIILVKPTTTEIKTRELINSAYNYGIKTGLTVIVTKIESTFLLPGDAVLNTGVASSTVAKRKEESIEKSYESFGEEEAPTSTFNRSSYKEEINSDEKGFEMRNNEVKQKKSKKWNILAPLITFLVCVLIGYGAMFLLFNAKHLIDIFGKEKKEEVQSDVVIMYVLNDNTPLYQEASLSSPIVVVLGRGTSLLYNDDEATSYGDFSYVSTTDGINGYILTVQMSSVDPTIGEDIPEIIENTPVPSEEIVETTPDSAETAPSEEVPTSQEEIPSEETTETTDEDDFAIETAEYPTESTETTTTSAEPSSSETSAEASSETPTETSTEASIETSSSDE